MKREYIKPDIEIFSSIISQDFCANGDSVLNELGYLQASTSDELDEEY